MKNILFGFLAFIVLSTSAFSDSFGDGAQAYNKGDYEQAASLYTKTCDMGYEGSCKGYAILNKQGK
ncbi:MAG: hypothetical protein AUK54_01395 [Helicobacteraceae bacterium CG2_30_36_10]|nr:MAG: hypothetical protein AUK54_01395 [Helicobacteraceae bacterium CG2_30_36_10]